MNHSNSSILTNLILVFMPRFKNTTHYQKLYIFQIKFNQPKITTPHKAKAKTNRFQNSIFPQSSPTYPASPEIQHADSQHYTTTAKQRSNQCHLSVRFFGNNCRNSHLLSALTLQQGVNGELTP